jgi:hypothetical protein
LAQIVKYPIVPLETKTGIYLVDKDILLKQLANGNKKIDIPARLPKYQTISKLERIENISNGTYIVLDEKSNYCGLFIK